MRLASVLSRGVKDEGGERNEGMSGKKIASSYTLTEHSVLERAQELHNSQCASFYKTTAETLEGSLSLIHLLDVYEMAF